VDTLKQLVINDISTKVFYQYDLRSMLVRCKNWICHKTSEIVLVVANTVAICLMAVPL